MTFLPFNCCTKINIVCISLSINLVNYRNMHLTIVLCFDTERVLFTNKLSKQWCPLIKLYLLTYFCACIYIFRFLSYRNMLSYSNVWAKPGFSKGDVKTNFTMPISCPLSPHQVSGVALFQLYNELQVQPEEEDEQFNTLPMVFNLTPYQWWKWSHFQLNLVFNGIVTMMSLKIQITAN